VFDDNENKIKQGKAAAFTAAHDRITGSCRKKLAFRQQPNNEGFIKISFIHGAARLVFHKTAML
jgi:hypothetical protein